MKTPMQEHIEWLKKEIRTPRSRNYGKTYANSLALSLKHAESLLEKEEKVMCKFAEEYQSENDPYYRCDADELFNKTFKTKER